MRFEKNITWLVIALLVVFASVVIMGATYEDTRHASNLCPVNNNGQSLGSSSLRWKDLYLAGTATLANATIADANIAGVLITGSSCYTTAPSTYSWTATADMLGKIILCDSSTGDITITLPTAIGLEGKTFTFKIVTSTGKHTVDGAGSERIDAATTHATMDAINDTITIKSLGVLAGGTTDWVVIDHFVQ